MVDSEQALQDELQAKRQLLMLGLLLMSQSTCRSGPHTASHSASRAGLCTASH